MIFISLALLMPYFNQRLVIIILFQQWQIIKNQISGTSPSSTSMQSKEAVMMHKQLKISQPNSFKICNSSSTLQLRSRRKKSQPQKSYQKNNKSMISKNQSSISHCQSQSPSSLEVERSLRPRLKASGKNSPRKKESRRESKPECPMTLP